MLALWAKLSQNTRHYELGVCLTHSCASVCSLGLGLLRDCVCVANEGRRGNDVELFGETETALQTDHW